MKYFLALFFSGLVLFTAAQAPQVINYQGMARDAAGAPLINQKISVRFEIVRGTLAGTVIYTEDQVGGITTNALGLFTAQIGKNTQLSSIDWQNGPYSLQVSLDLNAGQNFAVLGSQFLASVPYALATPPPVLSYTSDILTVNGSTVQIQQPAGVSLNGGTNINISGGPSYSISSTPSLSINNGSIGISGGNSVLLPSSTITGAGMAIVSPTTGSNFVVGVPTPTYVPSTGVLAFGNSTVNITQQLTLNNGSLTSGPTGNSVPFPPAVTVSGSGMAAVSGAPDYTVTVPQPTLSFVSGSLGITNGNTIALPPFQPQGTVTPGGIVNVTSPGTNSFNVSVPLPTYAPSTGVLSFGTQNTIVTPTLMITGNTLSVGPPSNSVNLSAISPWTKSTNAVTLTTGTDRVGIGANAGIPTAKLDVQGETTLTVPVLNVNNTNAANPSAALLVSTQGTLGIDVTSNNVGGIAGKFSSSQGSAITANNNSSFYAIQATNTNTLPTSYAGYFDGGFVAKGKGLSTNLIISAQNATTDVFVVRNDGKVGIGTNTPLQTLDVAGTVKITDGSEAAGRVLTSDVLGNASWKPVSEMTTTSFSNRYMASVGATPTNFASSIATFVKSNADTKVQVIVQTHIMVQDLNGVNSVLFEIKIGNTSALNNTGRVNYFQDNGGVSSSGNYMPVTIIAEFAGGLPAGSYNVNISVAGLGGAGTATDIYLDPGNFNASSVIIKEYR